jgi:hypothetical protein
MRRRYFKVLGRPLACAGILLAAATGCCFKCGQFKTDHCADFPAGAMPQPVGTYACRWQRAHQNLADDNYFEVYENEWFLGGAELGRGGQRHLQQMAKRLMTEPHQVRVQPHFDVEQNAPSRELNDARVAEVIESLAELGVENAGELVVLSPSRAEPLHGPEATRLGDLRLQGSRGGLGLGGGIGGSMAGGSGFGGMSGGIGGGFGGGY